MRAGHRNLRDGPNVGGLRRAAVVVAQHAAETFATRNRRSRIGVIVDRHRHRDRRDQPIVEALVVAFEVVVLDELEDRETEVALAKGTSLSRYSDLMESTKRSANAFRLGLRAGSLMHLTPAAPRTAWNASVNNGSRS